MDQLSSNKASQKSVHASSCTINVCCDTITLSKKYVLLSSTIIEQFSFVSIFFYNIYSRMCKIYNGSWARDLGWAFQVVQVVKSDCQWVSHWVDSIKHADSFKNETFWASESITQIESFRNCDFLRNKQATVFTSESFNHLLNWFIKKYWLIQEQNKRLFYTWVIESLNWFVQTQCSR